MINLKMLQENSDYRSIQNMFCSISLKSYFHYLYSLTDDEYFLNVYNELVNYANPNSRFLCDFDIETDTCNEDIPIGDMLLMGINMIYNTSDYYPEELISNARYIGQKILEYIIILPFMTIKNLHDVKTIPKIKQ